jgi:hypothetical protein
VNVGKIVPEAVDAVEDAPMPMVEVEVIIAVNTVGLLPEDDPDDAEIAGDEAVGVVKVEMIPFSLMGYYQYGLSWTIKPVRGRWCKKAKR